MTLLKEQFLKENNYGDKDIPTGFLNVTNEYIEWLENSVPQWIGVNDILPDSSLETDYLLFDITSGRTAIGFISNNKFYAYDVSDFTTTHWMEFPTMPGINQGQ